MRVSTDQCPVCKRYKPGKKTQCPIVTAMYNNREYMNEVWRTFIDPKTGCKHFDSKEGNKWN